MPGRATTTWVRKGEAAAFGHFTQDGREYVITKPFAPPRAQINFLWNDSLISGLNQFGSGDGVFNNQTLMYNHPKGRVRLIRDPPKVLLSAG